MKIACWDTRAMDLKIQQIKKCLFQKVRLIFPPLDKPSLDKQAVSEVNANPF